MNIEGQVRHPTGQLWPKRSLCSVLFLISHVFLLSMIIALASLVTSHCKENTTHTNMTLAPTATFYLIDQSTCFVSFTYLILLYPHAPFISLTNQNGTFLRTHRPLTNDRAGFASFTYYANLPLTCHSQKCTKTYLLYYCKFCVIPLS